MPPNRKVKSTTKKSQEPLEHTILDAAEHVFIWKGYQQATMEILAREAGISVGTLYNFFKNKEDIYRRVAERIGAFVVDQIDSLAHGDDPERAVLDVIRLRLRNYLNDRLFFQPFSFPGYLAIQPEPERLGESVNKLYRKYVNLVEQLFGRCFKKAGKRNTSGMKMAVCLEGMITAYMGYWSGASPSSGNIAKTARHMRAVLLQGIAPAYEGPEKELAASRTIYITRYDMERLRELLDVVRALGKKESQTDASQLAEELKHARITNPREVPPDVITMNSRFRIADLNTGTDKVCTLVFPRDADMSPDNVSILNSFGTAVFGRRSGDVFGVGAGADAVIYQITQILYQPEAAGDYHL